MASTYQIPYRVRWATSPFLGLLLGGVLIAFAGTMALAGALSITSVATSTIVALVVASSVIPAIMQAQDKIKTLNFIEKSLFIASCSLVVVCAYYFVHQYIHMLRMDLAEHPEKMDRLMLLMPASERSLFDAVIYLFVGLLIAALGFVFADEWDAKKGGGMDGLLGKFAIASILLGVASLTFMSGRNLHFIAQAVGMSVA